MTKDQSDKLSLFIDDLLDHRFDKLKFDFYTYRKKRNYSIEIDSGVSQKPLSFGIVFGTQTIRFCVCEDGSITLYRDDYESFNDNDLVFARKYFDILQDKYIKKQNEIINSIIESSYIDLNLRRDSNISKLI